MDIFLWVIGVLVLVFVVVLVSAANQGAEKRKNAENALAALKTKYSFDEVYVSPFDCSCLGINWNEKRIFAGRAPDHVAPYSFEQFTDSEIEVDGATITKTDSTSKTRRGPQVAGAAVGGLVFGPLGLLVGGFTGGNRTTTSTQDTTRVRCIALVLQFRDRTEPIQRVVFWEMGAPGIPSDNPLLKEIVTKVNRYHALMSQILDKPGAADAFVSYQEQGDVSVELERLWSLRQSGALTQNEFDRRKEKILKF